MTNAPRDENGIPALLAVSSADGTTLLPVYADPTSHRLLVSYPTNELSADPSDPAEGNYVIWMSDGTGTGDDGDILIKITAGGVTKTTTLVDFSAV